MGDTILLKLTVGLLGAMLFRVDSDAGGAEGQKTLLIFAEIEDIFFGVEGAALWLVDFFRHRNGI